MGFYFDTFGATEEPDRYCPGGYHPVIIGDVFDSGRYCILHKLGFGSYATVWLAKDLRASTGPPYVALKISRADSSSAREAEMLQKVAGSTGNISLHHAFTIDGPNGKHQVLVLDVAAPLRALRYSQSPRWRKAAARGLILGVAQMHRSGVKHGDLHIGNIGCALPELSQQLEVQVVGMSHHELTIVLPYDFSARTPSLPPYLVTPCTLALCYERIHSSPLPDIKILDFGNARGAHETAGEMHCVTEVCSPEVVFARVACGESDPTWGCPTDVWAVGATICEIVACSPLFNYASMRDVLLRRMASLAGAVPAGWRSYWDSRPSLQEFDVSHDGAERFWAEQRDKLRKGCVDDADADRLVSLLRRMLVLDPEKRPTIESLAEDPWFQDGGDL